MFVASFGKPLTAQNVKRISINNEPFLARPNLTGLNPDYQFVISLDVVEVVVSFVIYLIASVFQTKQKT